MDTINSYRNSINSISYSSQCRANRKRGFEFWVDGLTLNNYLGVGLSEKAINNRVEFNCFPNPFYLNSIISLKLPKSGIVNISIYNLQGNLVKEVHDGNLTNGNHEFSIDTSNIPSGIYLLELKTGKHKEVKRIIRM